MNRMVRVSAMEDLGGTIRRSKKIWLSLRLKINNALFYRGQKSLDAMEITLENLTKMQAPSQRP